MNATAIRTAGRFIGAWGAIVFSVILLSVIFNILGAITCAVLVGMMLGAFKGPGWFSVSVSLVFPGVIFGLVRSAKVELTQPQVILLAALCFGAFWVTYLVSAYVLFCEQTVRKSSRLPAAAPQPGKLAQGGQVAATGCAPAAEPPEAALPARELCLEELQGDWVCVCEASGAAGPPCKKVIQIKEAKLELKAVDTSGRVTLLASGDVTLQSLRPA